MKKYTSFILSALIWCGTNVFAQPVKPLWSQSVPEGVAWQMVTSFGNYVIGTADGLAGIDPDKGTVIWRNRDVGKLMADNVKQLGSSPMLSVNTGATVYFIDPFSGQIKFDSRSAGINEIKDQHVLYQANGILISGRNAENKDILLMSSMADGKVAWKVEDDFGRFITANEISPSELLIVTLFYNYKVNPVDGKVIWKNDISEANQQMQNIGAFGNLMKQAAGNMAQNLDFNVQFYKHPTKPIFFVASEQEGKAATTGFTTTTSNGGPSFHTKYTAFDLNNGDRLWKKDLDLSGKTGGVYFDEKGLVVMPDDGANTKVNCYDYTTQAGQWGKKGRGVNVKGGIYGFEKVKDGFVLMSQNASGKNFLSFLSLATGELTFDKPVQIDGRLIYSEATPKGLFFLTTEEINILDLTTGKLLLDKGISTAPALTAMDGNTVHIFDTRERVLKQLDKTSGALKVSSVEIKFEGNEAPSSIEKRGTGILVSSSQNMTLIGADGKQVYKKYFEAPREPGVIRALRYAQAVRAAYIGAAAYTASAAFQSAGQQVKEEDQASGAVLQGIGNAYGELGNAASDFAKKSFQAANARFKATQAGDNFTVMLTKQDKNNVLIKVNKDTGATEGVIDLGKDNAPNYTMDGVTGGVFYAPTNDKLTGYKF